MTSDTNKVSVMSLRARLRAMDDKCAKDPQCLEAQHMFDELFTVAATVAATRNHEFDEHAVAQLENHYKKHFYYALKVKGKTFDQNEEKILLALAALLGSKCVDKAQARTTPPPNGIIMRHDVHLAIFDIDCEPVLSTTENGRLKMLFEWCN